jgi:hypothetical protein
MEVVDAQPQVLAAHAATHENQALMQPQSDPRDLRAMQPPPAYQVQAHMYPAVPQGFAYHQALPTSQQPYYVPAAAPVSMPPEQMRENTLRSRVVCVAVSIGIYLCVAAILQTLGFYAGMEFFSDRLRGLDIIGEDAGLDAFLKALPAYIMIYAIPGLVIAMLYGFLFALCGCIGAKSNSSFCACCFCCCSAWHCVLMVIGLFGAFFQFPPDKFTRCGSPELLKAL